MLTTPAGICAACSASVTICVCQALISLGLITAVQPAAIAVASLLQIKPASLFHGVINPATPTGVITTCARPAGSTNSKLASVSIACLMVCAGHVAIHCEREAGAPYSVTIASSKSASLARTAWYIRSRTSRRCCFVVRDQQGKAAFAAAIARRASSSSASRAWPIISSVAGLNSAKVSLPCGVTNSPLI